MELSARVVEAMAREMEQMTLGALGATTCAGSEPEPMTLDKLAEISELVQGYKPVVGIVLFRHIPDGEYWLVEDGSKLYLFLEPDTLDDLRLRYPRELDVILSLPVYKEHKGFEILARLASRNQREFGRIPQASIGWEPMRKAKRIPDYQLCPYQDCSWKCGLEHGAGWYICPNCKREFWAEFSDGDYEDYHCFYEDDGFDHEPPKKPSDTAMALDLGPSWGTPIDNPTRAQ
jgi:hypothetical protein